MAEKLLILDGLVLQRAMRSLYTYHGHRSG